ncbi:unnamed protein product [Rhizopus stolonifer]
MLKITCQDIDLCSFSSWYPRFKTVTFKSRIIPLPEAFVDYLNAESIYLPEDGQPIAAATLEEIDSDQEEYSNQDNDHKKETHVPKEAIVHFEGAVFPKLNWSSPRDAAWIATTQTLKCTSPFDVFLLLKSSDFINHDLNHVYEDCEIYLGHLVSILF